jgi:hypothetical protein
VAQAGKPLVSRLNGRLNPARVILNGMMACALSLVMWKLTENFWGWLALAAPGALLIFLGWALAIAAP